MKWPLAVTLTSPNHVEAAGAIRSFRRALGKFRRTHFWGNNVKGGILSLEVTNTGKGWHVHAHALVDCRWLALTTPAPRTSDSRTTVKQKYLAAHHELSEAWAQSLGASQAVVWVERAYGKALLETIKYAVKPADLINSRDPIAPMLREMHRLQLVNGFGSCYGMMKKWKAAAKAAKGPCTCPECKKPADLMPTDVLNMKLRSGINWI